ncbi:MAG TPA: ABC transporter permease [Clostridia bacterium]|nr:ABC transporter permease [Clostridia bacterium]
MLRYAIRRLATGILIIILSTVILFVLLQVLPGGDPINLITNPMVTDEVKEEMRARWGLDKPAPVRFFVWASNLIKGDLGVSITMNEPVASLIAQRLPYTLMLMLPAMFLSYVISVPLGLITAYKKSTFVDKGIVTLSLILYSIPNFILGVFLIRFFSIQLKWLPISGFSNAASLVLPVTVLVVIEVASILRLVRSEVLEVTSSRFVETAYAKGLSTSQVLFRHVLRNSLIPVTIRIFLQLPGLITGAVIIEVLFALPGMGSLVLSAVMGHDYPVVQGIFLIIAVLTTVCNVLGELAAAALDPRVKLSMKGGRA